MFFELSCGVFKAKMENPRLLKVTVDGDAMTIPEIIEQMKKIVPHEKFNWEVFHLKDNIFRVKLPSKQEVQRLKNFGTYICTDRESCLSFDVWSVLEDPLYMLPEVWVRVSGLPSDVITDYLSLWGVGTLFGKTLDVDMAYTRKNKVLRIKIGCLDSRLIPADSDMFIRRGFFKLKFEVENAQGTQEDNTVQGNNGNDGSGDAKDGEGNNGDDSAMDMDPKKNEAEDIASNKGIVESKGANGGDGMQKQIEHLEAIQIGSISLKYSTSGSSSFDPNMSNLQTPFISNSNIANMAENDKLCTDFNADCMHGGSASGLAPVRPRDQRLAFTVQDSFSAQGSPTEQARQSDGSRSRRDTSGSPTGCGTATRDRLSSGQPFAAACPSAAGGSTPSGLPP
jgi:hypothetical protein